MMSGRNLWRLQVFIPGEAGQALHVHFVIAVAIRRMHKDKISGIICHWKMAGDNGLTDRIKQYALGPELAAAVK